MQRTGQTTDNRLAEASSPYLRQHGGNPVDWLPWGPEAFARARERDRPIFLSIGYSTCHWCHVMARESFENPAIATLLNERFVAVKVDREERPDVDRLHMAYVQATVGQGGWPLSVWLTPELKPFYGGTYFPPEGRWGRPGFADVLRGLADAWANRRAEIETAAAQAVDGLRAAARGERAETNAAARAAALRRCTAHLLEAGDPAHGGFGGAPKFPRPANLKLLFRVLARTGDSAERRRIAPLLESTLAGMARGGMCDQLGGGFHRYAVDTAWRVPHFEKMLYDQAQLVPVYLEGWQAFGRGEWRQVAEETLAYLERDLAAPEGGYYAAEDADSARPAHPEEHGEGAFYTWTAEDFRRAAGAAMAEAGAAFFGVRPEGNAPAEADATGELAGENVLRRDGPWPEGDEGVRLTSLRKRLLVARQCRPRPGRDEKIVTAWNGLALSALARAAQVLGEARWREAAVRTARFLRARAWDPGAGRLWRSWCDGRSEISGFAEDHAFLIAGLLDLHEAGGGLEWLEWAEELQARMDALYWDHEDGGYFGTAAEDPSILVRLKEAYDGAEPAANSVAALNLLRLAAMLGRDELRERALATIGALGAVWESAATALPELLVAADFAAEPPDRVVLVGRRSDPALGRLASALHRKLERPRVILWVDGEVERAWFARRLPLIEAMVAADEGPSAHVCRGATCLPPIDDPETLAAALDG